MQHKRNRAILAAGVVIGLTAAPAVAQVGLESDMGTTLTFGGEFCPHGTLSTTGQTMSIAQNNALYSLLGTTYGGDGVTTFKLPDLRGRMASGDGSAFGSRTFVRGEAGGVTTATLTTATMPTHVHVTQLRALNVVADSFSAVRALSGTTPGRNTYSTAANTTMQMAGLITMEPVGSGTTFDIINPSIALQTCIVVEGLYPSRN